MSSFEIGATRSVGAVQPSTVQPATQSPATTNSAPAASTAPAVQTSLSTAAGAVPVDQNRVDQIRAAVQNGTYPVTPAKIGDAMIAAGAMLQKAK